MRKSLAIFLVWASLIYGMAIYLPQNHFELYTYEHDIGRAQSPRILWHLANFDGVHYLNIAQSKYTQKFQTAFFPLYPFLTGALANLTGENYFVASLVISFISALGCSLILSRILGNRGILPLITFPTAFFLLGSYTESLFLLLELICWLSYKKKNYLLMAIFGALATSARFYGVFIPVVIFVDYYQTHQLKKTKLLPYLAFMFVGIGFYMAFLKQTYSDPIAFFHNLELWQKNHLITPFQTLYRYFRILTTVSPKIIQYWIALLELAAFTYGSILCVYYFKLKKYAFSALMFLGTIVPACTGTLQSLPRYLLVLFPIVLLPLRGRPLIIYLTLGSVLQVILFSLFLNAIFIS